MAYKKDNEIIELRMSQLVVTGKVWDNKKIKYFKFIEKKIYKKLLLHGRQ